MKLVPYSVTSVPPVRKPSTGWILSISTIGWYVKATDTLYTASLFTKRTATAPDAESNAAGDTHVTSSRLECVAATASAPPN